jgi:hypothetical protein
MLVLQNVKPSPISFGDWPSSQHRLNNRPADSLSLEVTQLPQMRGTE